MPGDVEPLRPQVYRDPRPAAHFERIHAYARTHEPDWFYTLVRIVSYPYCRLAFRLHAVGLDHVPAAGPVILAPNHFSSMDHWFVGILLRRRVRFMAKSQLFRGRVMEFILTHGGAFPVRRGRRDEEAMATARFLLERGGVVVIYIEGGRSRTGRMGDHARPGVGRLALETGAPIVPVAVRGSERVRNWHRFEFPRVTVHYGEPLRYAPEPDPGRERQQQVADEVHAAVRELHDDPSAGR